MKRSITAFVVAMLLFFGCGGTPQLSSEICETGLLVCDIAENICETFPLPDPVCSYVNIACVNIGLLCVTEPGTVEHIEAKQKLKKAKADLNIFLKKYKRDKLNE